MGKCSWILCGADAVTEVLKRGKQGSLCQRECSMKGLDQLLLALKMECSHKSRNVDSL